MRLSNLKIRTKILMVAGVPLLMAAAIAGVSLWALAQVEAVEGWVSHTNKVPSSADRIVAGGGAALLIGGGISERSTTRPWSNRPMPPSNRPRARPANSTRSSRYSFLTARSAALPSAASPAPSRPWSSAFRRGPQLLRGLTSPMATPPSTRTGVNSNGITA